MTAVRFGCRRADRGCHWEIEYIGGAAAYDVALVRGEETLVVCIPEVAAVSNGDLFVGEPWATWNGLSFCG